MTLKLPPSSLLRLPPVLPPFAPFPLHFAAPRRTAPRHSSLGLRSQRAAVARWCAAHPPHPPPPCFPIYWLSLAPTSAFPPRPTSYRVLLPITVDVRPLARRPSPRRVPLCYPRCSLALVRSLCPPRSLSPSPSLSLPPLPLCVARPAARPTRWPPLSLCHPARTTHTLCATDQKRIPRRARERSGYNTARSAREPCAGLKRGQRGRQAPRVTAFPRPPFSCPLRPPLSFSSPRHSSVFRLSLAVRAALHRRGFPLQAAGTKTRSEGKPKRSRREAKEKRKRRRRRERGASMFPALSFAVSRPRGAWTLLPVLAVERGRTEPRRTLPFLSCQPLCY